MVLKCSGRIGRGGSMRIANGQINSRKKTKSLSYQQFERQQRVTREKPVSYYPHHVSQPKGNYRFFSRVRGDVIDGLFLVYNGQDLIA